MLYSKSVEYAIKALGHLAQLPEGSHKMARLIAEEEDLPSFFLAKTLQSLARDGMLHSAKGPTGGFGLAVPAKKIRLLDVIEALDGLDDLKSGASALPKFGPIQRSIMQYLRQTTVADVAASAKRSKAAKKRPKR